MNETILLGESSDRKSIEIPLSTLKRHFVALGASGSGKTVLSKCIIEECTLLGIPSIIIDPQGDIASLIMPGREKSARREEYVKMAEVRIFTPASSKGIALSINPLELPPKELPQEEVIRALDLVSSSLVHLLGYDEDDEGKACQNFLYKIFQVLWRGRMEIKDFEDLAEMIEEPERLRIDSSHIISEKERIKLARKIRYLSIGIDQLLFNFGVPVDIDMFLRPVEDKKCPVNVIYLNTLSSEEHKQFFVAMIGKEIYSWMLQHPSDRVQLIFYLDEISPYLPPHPFKPPAKDILKLLFKQGRKYGLACLMNTQNPADVDYKAMAQANTWALGRMMAKQDLEKVKHILKALNSASLNNIMDKIPLLHAGEFILICPDVFDTVVNMKVRRLITQHRTLDEESLKEFISEQMYEHFEGRARERSQESIERFESPVIKDVRKDSAKLFVCKLNYPQNKATRIVEKSLGWTIPRRDEEIVGVDFRLLPLWELESEVTAWENIIPFIKSKLPFSKTRSERKKLYLNALNGKILFVKDMVYFSEIISEEPFVLEGLEEVKFEERSKEELPGKFIEPKISLKEAGMHIFKMFGITALNARLVLLPIWVYVIKDIEKGTVREIFLDGVFGKEVNEDPFKS